MACGCWLHGLPYGCIYNCREKFDYEQELWG